MSESYSHGVRPSGLKFKGESGPLKKKHKKRKHNSEGEEEGREIEKRGRKKDKDGMWRRFNINDKYLRKILLVFQNLKWSI